MTDTNLPPIVTYHSSNNKPEWFAYCKPNGEFLGVRFEGHTEAEAKERAKVWWTNETARQAKLTGKVELESDEVNSSTYKKPSWGTPNGWGSKPSVNEGLNTAAKISQSSEHSLAGKVWLANRELGQKKRVDPAEVDAMMKQGWFRAGPRTQL